MIPFITKKIPLIICCLFAITFAWAQKQTPLDIALRYTEQQQERWQLEKSDVTDMLVSSNYRTQHNGMSHFYFLQRHVGIPVYNAMIGVHVTSDGKIGFATNRFIANVAAKVNATAPTLSAEQAIIKAAQQLNLPGKPAPVFVEKSEKGELIFEDKSISQSAIKVRLMYQPTANGTVRLAWDLAIQQTNTPDYWSVRIDAITGNLLDKQNWTVYCEFGSKSKHEHTSDCKQASSGTLAFTEVTQALTQQNLFPPDNAQYNVFPVTVESPLHGQRQLLTNPANSVASPFGWHDTDGLDGAEFRFTRGNNVHAFLDTSSTDVSSKDEPQGGENLVFNFPFNDRQEPNAYKEASVTQLFYMNNVMHDFTYQYGFDEQAGNFQQNNYGKPGKGSDAVSAHAQDGGNINNANFSTQPDGSGGRMQMYLWEATGGNVTFTVTAPSSIAKVYNVGQAAFGLQFSELPITGRVVVAMDSTGTPNLACQRIINSTSIAGNIALIDRGDCTFKAKTNRAQAAGAIGVIICNYDDAIVAMGNAADVALDPTIPAVSLSASNCRLIRERLNEGVFVSIQLPKPVTPFALDGSFDNGIIAHEYGHGISTRLTGGPDVASCLRNDEQMGEGWSDFFTLITTVKPGDTGTKVRSIGTYVFDRDVQAGGIRRQPYSTDMTVNTQTYDDVIGTQSATNRPPHPVGEPWAVTLWDLYWKLSDVYGWDSDLYNGTGGNNLAIQLVMDGMKLQACNPGFIDGRDAILAADILNNQGANQCLIWEVFARRGLGWSADQGNPDNRNDGRQGFDTEPTCIKELKIAKTATALINPGETITYTITVTNHKTTIANNVIVRDALPQGTSYIAGSVTNTIPTAPGAGFVTFQLGSLMPNEEKVFSYKVSTSTSNASTRLFLDNFENDTTNWTTEALAGTDGWKIDTQLTATGSKVWFVRNTNRRNDQTLELRRPLQVVGNQPVLRFYHNYNTDPGWDGGIVEISTNAGTNWQNVDSLLFRNGYRGRIAARTFSMDKQNAYWGSSSGFVGSYIDLSPFIGQAILVRFRFGSSEQILGDDSSGTGWSVDDVELLDVFNYQSEACVTSAESDQACAAATSRGTVVEPRQLTDTDEPESVRTQVTLYPNPAKDVVNVGISTLESAEAVIQIFGSDGRSLSRQEVHLTPGSQVIPLKINQLQAGFYLIEIRTPTAVLTEKLIVK